MPADDLKLRTSVAEDLGSLENELLAIAATPEPTLAAGTVIAGHFEIEELIGRGGMGAVYRARDTKLDRLVAIKVGFTADLDRARREATALARLVHPNVVTIYAIDAHEGRPFAAMELVTGGTARDWLAKKPRGWREIVALYADAARGLAAAHDAGLIHRDVKPENILVGADGRARVADFGLARDASALTSPRGDAERDRVVTHTTTTGGPSGTPRYMAPEQQTGDVVDARADQFSLAVALYEALSGVDPFPQTGSARLVAIRAGRRASGKPIPRRISAGLSRALAFEPADRWPSMHHWVRSLDGGGPRWPIAAAFALLLLVAAAALLVAQRDRGNGRVAPSACATLPDDLSKLWNANTRRVLETANPKAAPTAAWLAEVIDHDAKAWIPARKAVCVDDLDAATWSREMLDDAAKCLANRLPPLEQAIALRDQSAGALVAVAKALNDPAACADPIAITRLTRRPADAARLASVDEVERLIADATAANSAGDANKAKALSETALAKATSSGEPLAKAIALEAIGEVELGRHDLAPAIEHFKGAYFEYRGLADQAQTYRSALMVTQLLASSGKLDEANEWLGHARAEAERTTATPEKRAAVAIVAAQLLAAQGKPDDAVAAIDRVLPRVRDDRDPRYRDAYVTALTNKAMFQGLANHLAESLASARLALEVQERIYGTEHPDLLINLQSIGYAQRDLGQLDAAIATLDRARRIAITHIPEPSSTRVQALIDHGVALGRKDPKAAIPSLEQARREGAKLLDAATLKELDDTIAGFRGR